jgi:GT2 family glycosyltransferase
VVVDNASQDGSVDGLEERFRPWADTFPLHIIRNQANRGFSAACNQGAEGNEADYLLFLNPDTECRPDSLGAPIHFLEQPANRDIGILGITLEDETGAISRNCARFPTARTLVARSLGWDQLFPRYFPRNFMVEWDHASSRDVDQVMGAFFLVRRAVWDALGGLDERFFVFYEDLDFAYRARQAGWRSHYWTGASVFHRGRGTTDQVKARRLAYNLHSRLLYSQKHFSHPGHWAVTAAVFFLEPWTRLLRDGLVRRSPAAACETARGFALLWATVMRRTPGTPVRR